MATMTFVQDVEVLPDGRLMAFGWSDVSSFVARFDANGLIDTSYGVDGYALFDFGDLHMLSNPQELLADGAVDAEGRAYWCGNVRSDFNIALSVLALARLTPAGMLDPAYSGDGRFQRRSSTCCAELERGRVQNRHARSSGVVRLPMVSRIDSLGS
ncbi:MAG: hypothetical protein IPK97_20890 [Ahniella sp.]|nr:hypothetical protein [Ahniella sp.]